MEPFMHIVLLQLYVCFTYTTNLKITKVFTLVPEKEKTETKSKYGFNQRANGNHKTDKIYLYALL